MIGASMLQAMDVAASAAPRRMYPNSTMRRTRPGRRCVGRRCTRWRSIGEGEALRVIDGGGEGCTRGGAGVGMIVGSWGAEDMTAKLKAMGCDLGMQDMDKRREGIQVEVIDVDAR